MNTNKLKDVVKSYIDLLNFDISAYDKENEQIYQTNGDSFGYDVTYVSKTNNLTSCNIRLVVSPTLVNAHIQKRVLLNPRELPLSGRKYDVVQEEKIANFMLDNGNVVIIVGKKNQYGVEDQSGKDTTIFNNTTILDSEIISINAIGVEDNFDLTNGISATDYNEKNNVIYKKYL